MSGATQHAVDIAVCDRHGLRYNRATENGCVRCRREAGARTPATGSDGRAAAAGEREASAPIQLLLAAALIVGTGILLWNAQPAVLSGFLSPAAPGRGTTASAPGLPAGWAPDLGTPPASPAPAAAIDPAAAQRQANELLRQLQEGQQQQRRQLEGATGASGDPPP